MILQAVVSAEQEGLRLDDGLKALFPQLSKTEIRRLIDWGSCTVNMALVRVASRALRTGDAIALGLIEKERCLDLAYTSADMLYEDRDCLAVNKAVGINSQRTPYQLKGTAEYAVGCYLRAIGLNEDARIVQQIRELSEIFEADSIAEHVEDEVTLERLRLFGVRYGQGYYFGRPQAIASYPWYRPNTGGA